jgi:hypothetical protein
VAFSNIQTELFLSDTQIRNHKIKIKINNTMKSIRTLLLATVVLLSSSFVYSQTADEIINKHIDAIGGKEKLSNLKTIYVESTLAVMGQEAPAVTSLINGKAYKNEIDFGGQKVIQVITDKDGWGVNPMMGAATPTAMTGDELKANQARLVVGGLLYDYAARGNTVELLGREDVSGTNAYKIKASTKDNVVITYYIDPATYYIIKETQTVTADGQPAETISTYSNYKKTDYGYVAPYTHELTLPQGITITINTNKIEVNKEIDPKIFEMPK